MTYAAKQTALLERGLRILKMIERCNLYHESATDYLNDKSVHHKSWFNATKNHYIKTANKYMILKQYLTNRYANILIQIVEDAIERIPNVIVIGDIDVSENYAASFSNSLS